MNARGNGAEVQQIQGLVSGNNSYPRKLAMSDSSAGT